MSEVHSRNENAQYHGFWGPQTALGVVMHLYQQALTMKEQVQKLASPENPNGRH